jgi:HPt (histidine-containing phosphotransfer) domain-containing protein
MKNGFDGFLSKPIQTVQLNTALIKFIKDKQSPEVLAAAQAASGAGTDKEKKNGIDDFLNSSEVYHETYKDFVRTQKNVMKEMFDALESNDIKTAHRLAHTLKGLAAMIGENGLMVLARAAEDALRSGNVPAEMDALNKEVGAVMAKIEKELADSAVQKSVVTEMTIDKAAAKVLLDRVAELLAARRGAVMNLTEELAAIPHTEALIENIEDFEFEAALESLSELRKNLEA